MNRRTVLRSAGVCATISLAGCLAGFRDHFQGELRNPIPIEIFNEGSRSYNVQLRARDRGTDRGTYDQGFAIRAGERVKPPSLEGIEQSFQVTRFDESTDDNLVEVGAVTPETRLVQITLYDDDLELVITSDEDEQELEGNESGGVPLDEDEIDDT